MSDDHATMDDLITAVTALVWVLVPTALVAAVPVCVLLWRAAF